MGSTSISTASVHGGSVVPISVEVDIRSGIPLLTVIGLPDARIKESKDRIRSAIRNAGYPFPQGRITVNLTPAELPKHGTGFDLVMAAGILAAAGVIPQPPPECWFAGEVSLSGRVQPFQELPGIIVEAVRRNIPLVLPKGTMVLGGHGAFIAGLSDLARIPWDNFVSFPHVIHRPKERASYAIDTIVGQVAAKRAVAVAAAGCHNLLLTGPAGVGKTSLAGAAHQLLPEPTDEERLELMALSAFSPRAGGDRPFRVPHHRCSAAALLGGGQDMRPGELPLAHLGILFMDELPLFKGQVLEALRQPLQDGVVRLSRAGIAYEYPARALVIAACNSCACGLAGLNDEICRCTQPDLQRYAKRISGPLYDRFALHVGLDPVRAGDALIPNKAEGGVLRRRIDEARSIQYQRNGGRLNSQLKMGELLAYADDKPVATLLEKAVESYGLTGRGIESVLSVALTISDLEGVESLRTQDVAEALQYRRRGIVGTS